MPRPEGTLVRRCVASVSRGCRVCVCVMRTPPPLHLGGEGVGRVHLPRLSWRALGPCPTHRSVYPYLPSPAGTP
eukprot:scaffold5244_cov122-Isochrysis_galbana.AAC.1